MTTRSGCCNRAAINFAARVMAAFLLFLFLSRDARAGAAFDWATKDSWEYKAFDGFKDVFGVTPDEMAAAVKRCEIRQISCDIPANVFCPGESPSFVFQFVNKTKEPIRAEASVEVVAYGARTIGASGWGVPRKLVNLGTPAKSRVSVDLPADGFADVKVKPDIPSRFGGYFILVDLPGVGRQVVSSCVRVPKPAPGRVQEPQLGLDIACNESSVPMMASFQRLGVKAQRMEVGYLPTTAPNFEQWFKSFSERMKRCWDHDVTVMVTSAAGGPQPLGRWRPPLTDDNRWTHNYGGDFSWLPSSDADYRKWVKLLTSELGYPKGPINAWELWNEPWEVASISGWAADMPRYHEIFTAMCEGVEDARHEAGVKVLTGGCSSTMNTEDKLLSCGTDRFLPWLDFVSAHYQGVLIHAPLVRQLRDRKSPRGPTRTWDTESWLVSTEERLNAALAAMLAAGYDRVMGMHVGNCAVAREDYKPRAPESAGKPQNVITAHAFSPGAGLAAFQSLIGERRFKSLLFTNGLPWIMVFDGLPDASGRPNPDDGTLVVVGDLGAGCVRNAMAFRSVQGLSVPKQVEEARRKLDALRADAPKEQRKGLERELKAAELMTDGSMTMANEDGKFRMLDYYGNDVSASGREMVVPLNDLGYYLRTDGSKGSFEKLLEAARSARLEGYEPLDVQVCDMTDRVEDGPVFRVRLANIYNRPIAAKMEAELAGLELEPADARRSIEFAPHETKDLSIKVIGGKPAPENSYPLTLVLDAGKDGRKVVKESLRVNLIARRAIKIDGDLADWDGVLPQTCGALGSIKSSDMEKAWRPWEDFADKETEGFSFGYLAYDDAHFYFAARIADKSPDEGTLRFETRDESMYYYPEVTYFDTLDPKTKAVLKTEERRWPEGVRRFTYRGAKLPAIPVEGGDNVQIAFNVLPEEQKPMAMNAPGLMPRFSLYPSTDYEYVLNKVAEKWGGGTELWRLQAPGVPRKHYYPRQPKAKIDGGPVKDGKLVIKNQPGARVVEMALPWSEIPRVKERLDAGQPIKFSYRVNNNKGASYELNAGRSVSQENGYAFQPFWVGSWATETEFGFEPARTP